MSTLKIVPRPPVARSNRTRPEFCIIGAIQRTPGDQGIGLIFGDFRIPFDGPSGGSFRLPMRSPIAGRAYFLKMTHEFGKLSNCTPPLIHLLGRAVDDDCLWKCGGCGLRTCRSCSGSSVGRI